jgi:hypothetical protein
MNEESEKVKERNVLHVTGKFLKFNNVSRKWFKINISWCQVEGGIISCKF